MKNYIKIFLLSVFAIVACTEVQIPEIPVASMLMNEDEVTLSKGKTFALSVTMLPEDATDKTIVWKSTKESVATVTPDGIVTAVGFGTSYIVATNPASSLTAACMITVQMKAPYQIVVSEVGGNEISQTVFGYPGMTLSLDAKSTDNEEHTYEWTSSALDYVSVEDGLLSWRNAFAAEAPLGYLLYAESQIEVKAEDGTATSFTAVNNVLSTFGLNEVSRQVGAAVKMELSESRTVQIYAKANNGISVLPCSLYSLKSSNNSIIEVKMVSDCWTVKSSSAKGIADIILTFAEREFILTSITIEEHVEEEDKDFGGNTENFPVDDDIDWGVEDENQEN